MIKRIFGVFLTTILLVAVLSGCKHFTSTDGHLEWISPDGVHYWYSAYSLAPRYGHDGNLVID